MKRLIASWGAILILAVSLAGCAQGDGSADAEGETAAAPTATAVDEIFENTGSDAASAEPVTLHQPLVVVNTNTPPAATNTPEPTSTPEITNTPEPTAVPPTNTPAPIPPTSPPPPPPTAVPPTEPPPPPPPPAIGARGLVASHFAIQDRAELFPKGAVWFEFTVDNQTGGEVPYHSLGVMPRKDGVDRPEWYQQSWKGKNSTIKAGGLSWEDNIKLPEEGSYTLRLVICFDDYEACTTRSGTYETLSSEIPITIKQ